MLKLLKTLETEYRNNQNDFFNSLEVSENIIKDERKMKCTKQQIQALQIYWHLQNYTGFQLKKY